MGDLISRQAVYEMLNSLGGCDADDEWTKGWDCAIDDAINELDRIPTAYDVDKVMQSLGKEKKFWEERNIVPVINLEKAIKIVKAGGKDE